MKKDSLSRPVHLEEMLLCRDARAQRQKEYLERFSATVISFTMNIPGPIKISPLIQRAFRFGMDELSRKLPEDCVLSSETKTAATGCEALFAVDLSEKEAKVICQSIEEDFPIGRLFDLDVIDKNGTKLSREEERSCLVCGKKGRGCSASRAHTVAELWEKVESRIVSHFRSSDPLIIARLAVEALKNEVLTTPKPGLVDQRNTGSHTDMTLSLFLASAEALEDYFADAVKIGMENTTASPYETFLHLRKIGLEAEKRMFDVTAGVNTHKGAIFSLGVLCGAIGRLWTAYAPIADLDRIFSEAKKLTEQAMKEDFSTAEHTTAGKRLYASLGLTGVRGEAAAGFPSVSRLALPVLERLLQEKKSLWEAGSIALLHLISVVEDTTLYHRGGKEGAAFAKKAAGELLARSPLPSKEELEALDDAFIARNLSPGGCADLLAISYFLNSLSSLS